MIISIMKLGIAYTFKTGVTIQLAVMTVIFEAVLKKFVKYLAIILWKSITLFVLRESCNINMILFVVIHICPTTNVVC